MGKLVDGDDGLLAEEVGIWAKEKHEYLCRYIDTSRAVRAKFIGENDGGATFIDLFCGPGRCRVKDTGEWIDGGAVAAWKKSCESGTPFTSVYIGDLDVKRRQAAATRLRELNAPVIEVSGPAVKSVLQVVKEVHPYGLNFAFLDPYDLANLSFDIIVILSRLKRIDMLVHVSQMDLQRNAISYATTEESAFDLFAPGWREVVAIGQSQQRLRQQLFQYWRDKVAGLGVWPSTEMRLLTGKKNQPLYWLLMAAKHPLPHKFWTVASNIDGQCKFDF